METLNFSHLGHSYLKYANPLSESKIDQAIEQCRKENLKTALDIGAGNFYILKKIVENCCESGVGIELPNSLNQESLNLSSKVNMISEDANTYIAQVNDDSFDLGVCIGSSHALGGYEKTLKAFKRVIRPGGILLIGDGYWAKKPEADYLNFLESKESDLLSHSENLKLANSLNLTPLWARTATKEEWDNYEWKYSKAIEDFFFKNPNHPQKNEFLSKISNWREGVWDWGRDTLGFGIYMFRN